ncbi:MAG: hypothetical protein K6F14_07540, partial [Clostridiales bacterium]|nr:hypothetical protein [Clostridiales bacterium]
RIINEPRRGLHTHPFSFYGLKTRILQGKQFDMIKGYFLQNWPLLLILIAFVISLITTVFLDKKTTMLMAVRYSATPLIIAQIIMAR